MQRQAIGSRHEDTREALAQIGARGGVAASFREVAFPMASVKEHQSRTKTFARRSILWDASAPQGLVGRALLCISRNSIGQLMPGCAIRFWCPLPLGRDHFLL